MDFKNAFDSIVPDLREKIGLRCPQLKLVCLEMGIEDVRKYGYEFCWGGNESSLENINGRQYNVLNNYERLKKLLDLDDCKRLSASIKLQDEIYECYMKVVNNAVLFEKAMNDRCFHYFRSVYEQHKNEKKVFEKMNRKYSIVATFLFSMYHYNSLKK